jgi:hypothetical protein
VERPIGPPPRMSVVWLVWVFVEKKLWDGRLVRWRRLCSCLESERVRCSICMVACARLKYGVYCVVSLSAQPCSAIVIVQKGAMRNQDHPY